MVPSWKNRFSLKRGFIQYAHIISRICQIEDLKLRGTVWADNNIRTRTSSPFTVSVLLDHSAALNRIDLSVFLEIVPYLALMILQSLVIFLYDWSFLLCLFCCYLLLFLAFKCQKQCWANFSSPSKLSPQVISSHSIKCLVSDNGFYIYTFGQIFSPKSRLIYPVLLNISTWILKLTYSKQLLTLPLEPATFLFNKWHHHLPSCSG